MAGRFLEYVEGAGQAAGWRRSGTCSPTRLTSRLASDCDEAQLRLRRRPRVAPPPERSRRDHRPIQLYDTTLRDGMQREGMSLSVEEKLRVAHTLDELGVHFIEAGFPASNPKEHEFFERWRAST